MMEELKVFEKTEDSFIIYSRRKIEGPAMTPRDSLVKISRHPKEDGKVLYIVASVERDDLYPLKEGVIRMDQYKA